MKNTLLIFFCLITLISKAYTQNKQSVWDTQVKFSEISPENITENVVGIFMNEKFEYTYDESGNIQAFHTIHKKIRINNNESINDFNKITVSLSNVIELIEIKARAIKPDGSIVIFDESSIKEIKDEDDGKSYKLFAIDGIEVGDDIEYYIIRKMEGLNFGRTFFQFSYPLQKASFTLIAPKNLIYAVKGYNGFPDAKHTILEDERNQFACMLENIPSIKNEKFAYLTPRKARIDYRLDYNSLKGKHQLLTWDDAAKRVYNMLYQDVNTKHLEKWVESIPLTTNNSLEKAAQIEDYIKNNIYIQDFHHPEFSDLEFIFENKVSSEKGIAGLYAKLFKRWNINHQIVITSKRDNVHFDGDFQSWNYLDKYLIYLPDNDTYIDPSNIAFRLGCIDGELSATEGLFVKLVKIGNFESAIGIIKYINATPASANFYNMHIDFSIDVDNAESHIITTRSFKGLSGGFMMNYYKMMDEETKLNTLKAYLEDEANTAKINRLELINNCDLEYLKEGEFISISDINTSSFIEFAGNKILLNIGKTIGTQVEMYFEEDRKAAIENSFNRLYYREIIVHIPDGYQMINPEVADMNFVQEIDNKKAYGFISTHHIEGNIYKIVIDEYYNSIYANIEQVEKYKTIVNAAADFNKIVLVLEEI